MSNNSNYSNGPNIIQVGNNSTPHFPGNAAGGGGGGGGAGSGHLWTAGPLNSAPMWTQSNNISTDNQIPSITLKKFVGYEATEHSLEKIEPKKWKIINLTFEGIIALQDHGIKYTWSQENETVYLTFDTEEDESQAIMLIGSIPYDKD